MSIALCALRCPAGTDRWWTRELTTEVDPISLEPLRALRYPPFKCSADLSLSHATDGDWFDGRVLASYLVSSGNFCHPISRRDLTRENCEALDAYLSEHRLGKAQVAHAFDHREEYKKARAEGQAPSTLAELRGEAERVLQALFSSPRGSRVDSNGASGGGRAETGRQGTPESPSPGHGRHAGAEQRGRRSARGGEAVLERGSEVAGDRRGRRGETSEAAPTFDADGNMTLIDDDLVPGDGKRGHGSTLSFTSRRRTPSRTPHPSPRSPSRWPRCAHI